MLGGWINQGIIAYLVTNKKPLKMGVRFFFYLNIILIFYIVNSESSEKIEHGKCVNDFEDLKGNKIDLKKQCKFKTCVPKCCGDGEIIFKNTTTLSCINITALDHKQTIPTNMNITIYKHEKTINNYSDNNVVFIKNNKFLVSKKDQKGCSVKDVETEHFHIIENSSLLIGQQRDKIQDVVDIQNYCVDRIVHSIGTEMKGPAFYFKLVVPQPPVCADNFADVDGNHVDIKDYCYNRHCIAKCCKRADRIMYYDGKATVCQFISKIKQLTNTSINVDYSKINIYRSNIEEKVEQSHMKLDSDFRMVTNKKLSNKTCVSSVPNDAMNNFHILENNSLVLEHPNFYKRFVRSWPMGDFCFEHLVIRTKKGVRQPFVIYRYLAIASNDTVATDNKAEHVLKSVAMLISCFFLILVLCVYGVIRELRNLVGMVLMAYVGTLAVTFFFKAVELIALQNESMSSKVCKPLSVFLYYTTISSFFWMNIMSLDIWWTFRAIFKCRRIHRRGDLVKFGWYALYSWGVPLLLTIAVAAIDYSDLSHMPHIYQPHFQYCFYIKDNQIEMRHYLYMPILGLLILDCIFYLMTAFNIWRIRKSMGQFTNEAGKYNNNQNRFGLYLKLSLVMGISWVFDMIALPWYLERVATAYNSLIGVAIFFIFVFKRKILLMLCKRFSVKNKFVESLQRKYSSGTVSNSQDRKRSAVEMSAVTSSTPNTPD
ncbi:probable G-protein coupled receptor Mth-like 3 isoform X2 [Pectinophora gossypiella]|uniref:probable G-protein coupled receptor Mth-like 3 isoform X2 n=1 Tax=Pectinophora gossypiella TaxID=13191 RepID=UPI00214E2C60|nr:probable G-protein coupled receptor Mth-like 3 isoform X2 [Pectinophora gossypiella]